jgi:hypothetical protein
VSAAAILAALVMLPVCWDDRREEARSERLQDVATAIDVAASGDDGLAALLVTVGYHESRFCRSAHAGGRRGRGEGIWQIEAGSRRQRPFSGLGLAATTHAAGEAAWLLRHSWQCGSGPAARLTAYAGRTCGEDWPTLRERVATYWWALTRLRKAEK